ncbi:glutathione S-transferase family protein [Cellvibrio sp. OA-2007]|uniref:glutathione S-transferase family protein n=1 Tax=Cellvibrio sp. OA-2007 TaxID=529823 RepID=UPI0007856E28|nr:glutathione S-transferase family protein [Cellvibrio sp. OA-2007]
MYQLFYYPRNASFAPHMLLAEMQLDYELVLVDRKTEAQKNPEYLKLNPTGRIPTLVFEGEAIYESAAICLFLCEQHPEKNMMPAQGTIARAKFYQWLFYLNASLQPELMVYFYPQKHTCDESGKAAIKQAQQQRIEEMLSLLDNELENKKYLLGDNISACDFVLFMLLHWGSGLNRPPLSFPNLERFLRDMATRKSVRQVCVTEETSLALYV